MWPRSDASQGPGADMTATRRNKNAGLSGFVSFMKRRDAEAALREFDGYDWGGSVLRVGWSKAVPIAAKPMYGKHQCLLLTREVRDQRCIQSRSGRRAQGLHLDHLGETETATVFGPAPSPALSRIRARVRALGTESAIVLATTDLHVGHAAVRTVPADRVLGRDTAARVATVTVGAIPLVGAGHVALYLRYWKTTRSLTISSERWRRRFVAMMGSMRPP